MEPHKRGGLSQVEERIEKMNQVKRNPLEQSQSGGQVEPGVEGRGWKR